MSDTTKSLRPLVNRAPCWESEHEPVITFFTDNEVEWGFPFYGLLAAQYTPRDQTLALQWQGAQVRIQGPRTRDFFMAFAKGSATGIKANGADILSVQVILPPSPPPSPWATKGKNARMSEKTAKSFVC
jgi:hypothetical protein